MPHANKVMQSIQSDCGQFCVDIFMRPDGTYGFQAFRRDVEAGGWFPIASFAETVFKDDDEARVVAAAQIPWFGEILNTM